MIETKVPTGIETAAGLVVLAGVMWTILRRPRRVTLALAAGGVVLCLVSWDFTVALCVLPLTHSDGDKGLPPGWSLSFPRLLTWGVLLAGFAYVSALKSSGAHVRIAFALRASLERSRVRAHGALYTLATLSTFAVSFFLLSANAACALMGAVLGDLLIQAGAPISLVATAFVCGAWGSVLNTADVNCSSVDDALVRAGLSRIDPATHIVPAACGLVVTIVVLLVLARWTRKVEAARVPAAEVPERVEPPRGWQVLIALPFAGMLAGKLLTRSAGSSAALWPRVLTVLLFTTSALLLACRVRRGTRREAFRRIASSQWLCFRDVILLIAASVLFANALKACVPTSVVVDRLRSSGISTEVAAAVAVLAIALCAGSGDAAVAVVVAYIYTPKSTVLESLANPQRCGSILWFCGEMGRCASPASAATNTVATLEHVTPRAISSRAIIPLLCGALAASAAFFRGW